MSCLTNELDEDKKSIVAVECLVWLLPTLPQKADDTIDSALKTLEDRGVKQPMLLYVSGQYFIKADNTVITLPCCSCFIEALEYLLMAFYVFAVEYPNEFFYGFLERVLNMKSTVQSSAIADLLRQLTFVQKC
ncbi:uncharacterized protein LOC136079159 [Hydra vulgaris]|uniref:Uncharacterized protein LOC136079159 n=1 Tax=Hydra vulgaris TaxID=6087 RepID=A0ABM4BPB5_HYDVU